VHRAKTEGNVDRCGSIATRSSLDQATLLGQRMPTRKRAKHCFVHKLDEQFLLEDCILEARCTKNSGSSTTVARREVAGTNVRVPMTVHM